MKTIELTRGQVSLIDDDDFERVSKHKWCALSKGTNSFGEPVYYAKTGWKNTFKTLHRFIMNVTDISIHVDHKNGNKLDNRKENLRLSTHRENMGNCKKAASKSSQYIGVCKRTIYGQSYFVAAIRIDNKQKTIGYFKEEFPAAIAYDKAALASRGEFANLNFPSPCVKVSK